ncbi:prosaposin isoform X2 [Lycorma delicatula]|uniref:prosaposin isoform X2 n=1 Tax=Lycorma delicatula TaxID=130591 RepID=UPI003F516DB9
MMWLQCILFLSFGFSRGSQGNTTPKPEEKTALNWPDECQQGPGYWCQNLRSASDCGSLKHCFETVWLHQNLPKEDSSSICNTCVDYVSTVKEATSNNITVHQMEIVLDAFCHLIPQYIIGRECAFAVNHFLPDIQSYIKSVDPHVFCSTIFLCDPIKTNSKYFEVKQIQVSSKSEIHSLTSDASDTKSVAVSEENVQKKLACRDCYTLVTTGKKIFSRASKDEVLNKMIEICERLSSFSDACSAYVISYFTSLYDHLSLMRADDVCHLSGVCDELYHFHEMTPELETAVKNAPEDANDEVCDFCEALVDHVKDTLTANTTADEFRKVLEGICKQTGSFEDQCLELADNYYEIVYQFIVTELDGKEVCKVIRLCEPKKGTAIDEVVPLWPLVPSVVDLDAALKNETSLHKVALTKTLLEFSKPAFKHPHLLGSSKCTWGPAFWCKNMTTTKQCSGTLKHCIGLWEKIELPADNGDICNVCKDMVKQARDQLNSNETQEELREVLEGSCKLLPTKVVKTECIKMVDEFIPELIEALSSQMNPQVVCATVGLCNSARMDLLLQQEKLKKSEEVLPIQPLPLDRMLLQLPTNLPMKTEIYKRGKEACELCELFLHYIQQQITLPKSEDEIKKVVNGVCIKLPKDVATQCSSFIEVYGDDFIALLAQEIDPSVVCPSIGACPAFLGFIDNVKPTCPLCLLAVEAIENKVLNNKTVEHVEKALEGLCLDLPKNMQGDCEKFIKKSGGELVDSIMADFSPQETCQYLYFCPASSNSNEVPTASTEKVKVPDIETNEVGTAVSKPDNKCVICEFIMSKLDQELKDKKTSEEIKNTVNNICVHLPTTIKNECLQFVKQYADLVIELLAASLEPEQICTAIHLCKHDVSVLMKSMVRRCAVCEAIIGSLQGLSSDRNVEEAFEHNLHLVCDNLPKDYKDVCESLVSQLAPQIVAISHTIPSSYICRHLHVCPKEMHHISLISSNNCLQGPNFWCASTVNAATCGEGVIHFCQEHVWKAIKPMQTITVQKLR